MTTTNKIFPLGFRSNNTFLSFKVIIHGRRLRPTSNTIQLTAKTLISNASSVEIHYCSLKIHLIQISILNIQFFNFYTEDCMNKFQVLWSFFNWAMRMVLEFEFQNELICQNYRENEIVKILYPCMLTLLRKTMPDCCDSNNLRPMSSPETPAF